MPDDAEQLKRRVREALQARLAAVSPADAALWSSRICAQVMTLEAFTRAGVVMLYLPVPGEVDVRPIAAESLRRGKRVCLPRVEWATRRMVAVGVGDLTHNPGRHGLHEPAADAPAVPLSEIGFVLVPGVAFDGTGRRVGRGGGYYDRFLADPALKAVTCAPAFDLQVLETVPAAGHDIPIQIICTQSRLLAIGAG